eukprot:5147940-Amphidinium_carterae.1
MHSARLPVPSTLCWLECSSEERHCTSKDTHYNNFSMQRSIELSFCLYLAHLYSIKNTRFPGKTTQTHNILASLHGNTQAFQ